MDHLNPINMDQIQNKSGKNELGSDQIWTGYMCFEYVPEIYF